MNCARFALLSLLITCSTVSLVAQAPICDVTCSPDPTSASYAGAVAARPKMLNARGLSSPIQAAAGPQQVPMTLGSESYNYVIPILGLPGRAGMDLNLNLYYNSRVWDIDTINGTATFNADRDFPSYGFRLDFGYLEYDLANDQFILTERDGTKRALPNNGGYNSIDGSYINYNSATSVLTHKSGMTVHYAQFPSNTNLFRPVQLKDTNGNYIDIVYRSLHDQQIQSITDTLGRVINFHYDASDQLWYIDQNVAVTPVDPTGVRRYVTFSWINRYGTNYHWYNFGLPVNGAPDFSTALKVLAGCTYANGTGYAFTYGDWAIINRIDTLSASTPTPAIRSYVSYNYPAAATAVLSDAPTYTQETISPDSGVSNTSVWNYSATNAGAGIVTAMQVTDPLGAVSVTNLDPSTGLISSVQMKDSSGNVLRTTAYGWTTSGGANLPASVTTTLNDTGQQSSVQYSNYDNFGNPADVYEYDFGGALLRHTVTTYDTTRFGPQHILYLPTQVLVKNAAGTTVARTDLDYDTTSITNITDAVHHDNSLTIHGNLTSITRYSDAATPNGAVVRHLFYDSTGNVRTAELDCCNQKVFNFSVANQYAYSNSIVRGPTGSTQFTISATWSFDYGVMLSSTDENNQVTQYQYDSMNRSTGITPPPQGSTTIQLNTTYDDASASPTVTKSATPSTVTVPKTVTTFDGLGHVLQTDIYNGPSLTSATVVSSTKSVYDKMWRTSQVSNPFAPGETPVYAAFAYDPLGRTKQVTPPSSGYSRYDYSGNAVTVTDPVGKQRKSYTDALGRLVQVDEPGVVSEHIPANNYAKMQTDGNFVLYDPYNNPLWSTGTAGMGGAIILLQDDGNLVIYHELWEVGTYRAWNGATSAYDPCRIGKTLATGGIIHENECLESNSGLTFAAMINGDLQIYDRQLAQLTWHSNTYGHPGSYAILQSDGNFVIYDPSGTALWWSNTFGATLAEVEEDGRLIIYNAVWSAGTAQAPVAGSLTHPACDVGSGTGWTGVLGTGSCFVSPNGHYELLMQTDGNLVLNNLGVTPTQALWSTNTALTPLSLDVAFHTTYTYDPLGNVTGVSQAAITGQANSGQSRSYLYDGLGRRTSSTTPESGTVTNYYTALSGGSCGAYDPTLACRIQDARGVVKNFTYDGFNRTTAIQYTNTSGGADPFNTPPVTYQYDAGGAAAFALTRLTSITEGPATPAPVNSHTFTYDNLGRITKDTQSIDQRTYTVQYAYNLASEMTSITYPSNRVVLQTYDAIGRLCSIGASGSTCTSGTRYLNSLSYNAAGETLGMTMGNGVQATFTYNDHLQLSMLRYFKSGTNPDILNLSYDYTSTAQPNNNGQIQATHYFTQPGTEDQTKSESFGYDQLGRLSAAQTLTVNSTSGSKTWSLQWTYDRFGNRLTQHMASGDPALPVSQPTLSIDPATNRITNTGYTYDNAGNMTHDAAVAYTFDGANRLTKINTTAAVYAYFGSQRIKKVLGSSTTRYIYSGSKVIAEYIGSTPSLSTEYIYGGSQLLVSVAGSITTYHHPDHLSNRAESNSSGTRTRTFGHLPFGDLWYETGTADKWKFTGYEHDSGTGETGLDYAKFRYYGSSLGRFASPDLMGGHLLAPQSLNRYAYALNDPVNLTDPLGMYWSCSHETSSFGGGAETDTGWTCLWVDDGCSGLGECSQGGPVICLAGRHRVRSLAV